MEYCDHSLRSVLDQWSLNCFTPRLDYLLTCTIFKDLLIAVDCSWHDPRAHNSNSVIMHRDLKPPNVLVKVNPTDSHFLKLADFGLSKIHLVDSSCAQSHSSYVGTQNYIAPEVKDNDRHYDEKVDIYSLGQIGFDLFKLS